MRQIIAAKVFAAIVIAATTLAAFAIGNAAQAQSPSDSDTSGAGILSRLIEHPELERGQIDLRDTRFDEAGTMAAMLRRASLAPQRDITDTSVTLNRLRLDFQHTPDALILRDGVACHKDFAATFDGRADLPAGELHFKGVIWPVLQAGITGLLALTPVVGAFAEAAPAANTRPSRQRAGLPPHDPNFARIGLAYALTGSHTDPRLQINPFADEYPGALHRVAEICRDS